MKKKLSREFKIGVFGIAMIGLLYLSINFIKSNRVFSSDQTYYAVFSSANGLQASAPVIAKGFRVGTVEKVEFNLERQDIIVTFSVQKEYPVSIGSTVSITSDGLMGGQIIELKFAQNAQKYNNKDTVTSVVAPGILQMVGDEYGNLKEKLSGFADKLNNIMAGIEGVVSPENVSNLNASMAHLNSLTSDINDIVDSKKSSIEKIIGDLESLTSSLKGMMPKVDTVVGNFEKASNELPLLLVNASFAIGNLNTMLSKINRGEGSLGKVVNDEQLYANLASATESLNLLLSDLKENPKRYVNVTVFGKKTYEEKKADKEAKKADKEKAKADRKN